jgi:hypothetical protein
VKHQLARDAARLALRVGLRGLGERVRTGDVCAQLAGLDERGDRGHARLIVLDQHGRGPRPQLGGALGHFVEVDGQDRDQNAVRPERLQ